MGAERFRLVVGFLHPAARQKVVNAKNIMIVKTLKIGGLAILGIIVLSIVLSLTLGKHENNTADQARVSTQDGTATASVPNKTSNGIALNDFLKYLSTYDAGGFAMEPRPSDPHSFIGFSDDSMNALEVDERSGLVYKIVIFTAKGQTKDENALSLARLVAIPGYANGNNEDAANWIVSQLANMRNGFIAEKRMDNLNYQISWDTSAVTPKWKLQIEY